MDRGVREEDSSSPSANLKLIQADRTGTAGERIKLLLSDGSCFFVSDNDLRNEDLSLLDLVPGVEIAESVIERLQYSSALRSAREKALDLLARAPHTTVGLCLKLRKRGFETRIIEDVLESLQEMQVLDDSRFAENWLRSRSERRPEGRALLVSGLLRKGVGREIAEAAVDRVLTPRMEQENARRAFEKLKRVGENDPEKLMKKLRARGFAFPLIRRLVEGEEEEQWES
jgi:regulatory protein